MSNTIPSESSLWPHPILGVALDMDGLMFDTEPLYYEVGTELLARRGHEFTLQIQQEMMGRPGPEAMAVLVNSFGLTESCESLLQESDEIYAGKIQGDLVAMAGLFELVDLLDRNQVPFGVATSSRRRFAEVMLDKYQLRPRLKFLLTGDDVSKGKPDPEMYLKAADQLSVSPRNMMVLEDSENGCRAAVAAGACTVAVPGPHSATHDFTGVGMVAQSLADPCMLALLLGQA